MNWIDYEYPNTVFIVEVKYSGDIAIAESRCKDYPPERDNIFIFGFTTNCLTYEEAKRVARIYAKELQIPFPA